MSASPSRLVHAKLPRAGGAITPHETTAGDDNYSANEEQDEQEEDQVLTAQPPEEETELFVRAASNLKHRKRRAFATRSIGDIAGNRIPV